MCHIDLRGLWYETCSQPPYTIGKKTHIYFLNVASWDFGKNLAKVNVSSL